MVAPARDAALRSELLAAERIPYHAHVSPHVISTAFGHYVLAFRLGGASFESADDEQLNAWHERLNALWRNIASPQLALWIHVVRRRERVPQSGGTRADFAGALCAKYRSRLGDETLMVNELYLALVYRPAAGLAANALSGLLSRSQRASRSWQLTDALEACEKLAQTLQTALALYEPERLGVYEQHRRRCSSLLEYLAMLVNAEVRAVVLGRAPLNHVLATSRVLFGAETIEYRSPTHTRIAGVLGIKEYATPVVVGVYNRLLAAPFSFVLTQSFAFLSRAAAQGVLQRQRNRLENAGDFARSQAEELEEALDALTSGAFVMGDHHFSLQVLSSPDEQGPGAPAARLHRLNEDLANARSLLGETGITVAREDLALEAAFWSQLPGNFALRPRKAPISSRNFAAMAPLHNYPAGRAFGNHWGEAHAVLVTSARSPYYFSLHASGTDEPGSTTAADAGHTFICGPTGSGKTVLIGFLIAMLTKQGATQIVFDKDRGLEILVRALGGEYLSLRSGAPTGFNPLQLAPEPQHLEFLKQWLHSLVRAGGERALSMREQGDLEQALRGTLALEPRARRLSRLLEYLDPTDPEGVHARLARWCAVAQGGYAWAFDSAGDSVVSRLGGRALIGFDVTEFLDHPLLRTPISLYLFHLVRQLLDGRRLVCWIDEFWRLLSDPAFEGFAKDGPKTWRKLNGVMCLATQSADDVLGSAISRTIVEQTPTKVLFPNSEAQASDYIEGLGLTAREYRLVRDELRPGSRRFLIKQGQRSVVCQLGLAGFGAELAVISGRSGHLERMRRLIAEHGAEPHEWLPQFLAAANRE